MTPAQNTAAYIQGFEDGKRTAMVEIKRELQQRTWVKPHEWRGLTDEEIYMNCPNWLSQEQCKSWTQQIQAKLKERNK